MRTGPDRTGPSGLALALVGWTYAADVTTTSVPAPVVVVTVALCPFGALAGLSAFPDFSVP